MIQNSGRLIATAVFNVVGNIAQVAHYMAKEISARMKKTQP